MATRLCWNCVLCLSEFGEILPYLRGELSDALHKILVRPPVTSNNLTQNRDNLETVEIIEPAHRDGKYRLTETNLNPLQRELVSVPL